MANTTVKGTLVVEGLKELLDRLNAAKGKTETKAALRKGVRAGANVILKETKARCPVDTGLLKRSLKVKAMKRSRKHVGRIGVVIGTNSEGHLFKGKTFYAGMVEFGTPRIPGGRPFMRPAFDASKEAAIAAVKSVVGSEVERRLKGK